MTPESLGWDGHVGSKGLWIYCTCRRMQKVSVPSNRPRGSPKRGSSFQRAVIYQDTHQTVIKLMILTVLKTLPSAYIFFVCGSVFCLSCRVEVEKSDKKRSSSKKKTKKTLQTQTSWQQSNCGLNCWPMNSLLFRTDQEHTSSHPHHPSNHSAAQTSCDNR